MWPPPQFFELHTGLPREGPGDDSITRRAVGLLPELPQDPVVIDAGCGPGGQTLVLASALGVKVTAISDRDGGYYSEDGLDIEKIFKNIGTRGHIPADVVEGDKITNEEILLLPADIIVPAAVEVSRAWVLGSWDEFTIPKPFAAAVILQGEPMAVPSGVEGDALEAHRRELQERMLDLKEEARRIVRET